MSDPLLQEIISTMDSGLLQDCLEFWGADSQFEMACGECAEFAALIGKRCQGRLTPEMIADELADVLFMAMQMARLVPKDLLLETLKQKQRRTRSELERQRVKAGHLSTQASVAQQLCFR